jgi:hypothetical protein
MTARSTSGSGIAQRSRREEAVVKATVVVLFIAIILGLGNSLAILALQLSLLMVLSAFVLKDAIARKFSITANYGSLALLFAILVSVIWSALISHSDATYDLSIQIKYTMTFLSTLYIVWIFYHCVSNGILNESFVIKASVYAFLVYSIVKIITNTLIALEVVQITLLDSAIRQTLGTTFVRSSLIFGLIRINLPPDFGIPIVIFCVLAASKLNIDIPRSIRMICVMLLLISVIFAYSRYIWAATFLAVFFATLIVGRRLFVAFAMITILTVGAAATNQAVVDAVEYRFFSTAVERSDDIRENQQFALVGSIVDSPLLGKGLATYVPWLVRSKNSPYSYELQILATAMQFGLIGFLPIVVFAFSLISLIRSHDTLVRTAICGTYFAWVMAGLTNPSLIGRAAAMIFVIFVCLARLSPLLDISPGKKRLETAPPGLDQA